MVSAIENHHVKPGMVLPSGRKLATQLKVSGNTVVLAYQNLVDEGFIETRERSGYYDCDNVLSFYASSDIKPVDTKSHSSVDWNSLFSIQASKHLAIKKQKDWQKFPYAFLYGQYDKEVFPIADWRG